MIVTQTPLRLSFFGGGTDFPDYYRVSGGAVLTTAIDKYVYVIVKERFDDDIYINYSIKEIVQSVDAIRHELVREAMRMTGVERGVEITTLADVPSTGTGLGSSAAVTVGLLHALHTYRGRLVDARTLAEQACRIEVEILDRPIGKQDQYISAFGGLRAVDFRPDEAIDVERVQASPATTRRLQDRLLVFFTGRTRSAAAILDHQQQRIEQSRTDLDRLKACAHEARDLLIRGRLDEFGQLLDTAWRHKKALAEGVSDSAIDELYTRARAAGALGGKIAGAGGGGFLLFYVPPSRQDDVRRALAPLRELPVAFDPGGARVVFNIHR
ncbi:MAG: GHMP kinase [Chloroflexota bacterium]|nr:GHMP kinase [Chloroflexota bacterium]MDE2918268.1 GHMP kinase [Chloroflexota bacterium]